MKIHVDTGGGERLRAKINRRINFLGRGGIREVLEENAEELIKLYRRKVESWVPGEVPDLKEATKKEKRRQVGFVYPILKRTGELLDSATAKVLPPAGGRGWRIAVTFPGRHAGGVLNEVIAMAHINGEGNNPVRDFTKVSPQWVGNLLKQVRAGFTRR